MSGIVLRSRRDANKSQTQHFPSRNCNLTEETSIDGESNAKQKMSCVQQRNEMQWKFQGGERQKGGVWVKENA